VFAVRGILIRVRAPARSPGKSSRRSSATWRVVAAAAAQFANVARERNWSRSVTIRT